MHGIRCGNAGTRRDGQTRLGGQRWRCTACGRRCTARSTSAFAHHGFPNEVIAVAVRHSVRDHLSYADVVAWFAERGRGVDRRLHLALDPALLAARSGGSPRPATASWYHVAR